MARHALIRRSRRVTRLVVLVALFASVLTVVHGGVTASAARAATAAHVVPTTHHPLPKLQLHSSTSQPLAATPTTTPPTNPIVDAVFHGLDQTDQLANASANTLFGLITDGVCAIGNFLPPPGGLLCDIKLLQFTVHTVYDKPGGQVIVRDTFALAEVPTYVDITGDGIPDAIVFVGLTSLNQLSIHVQKIAPAGMQIPASVEIVVRDPSNVTSPSRIAVGYDQRTTSIPAKFNASATLESFSPLRINVGVTQTGANPGLTLTATLFQQEPHNGRNVQVSARVGYVPAPASMSYDLLLDGQHQHLTYIGSVATVVTGDVDLIDGSGEQTIHVVVDKLPLQADVDMVTTDTTHRTVTYHGKSTIAHITFLYENITHTLLQDILNTEVTGAIQSLPTGLSFTQNGAATVQVQTQGGAIGVVEGGIAHGEHVVAVAGAGAGARAVVLNGQIQTAAVRLAGFEGFAVQADQTPPPNATPLTFSLTTAHAQLFVADATIDALHVLATINQLPSFISFSMSQDLMQHITYTASAPIGQITVDATSTTPFFSTSNGDVTHVHVILNHIPQAFTLTFGTIGFGAQAGTVMFSMKPAVGSIDFAADDGINTVDVPGTAVNNSLATDRGLTGPVDSGLAFYDLPGHVAIHGLVYGLSAISFLADPLNAEVVTAGGHKFDVMARMQSGTDPETDMAAELDTLPADVSVSMDRSNGMVLDYNSHGEIINRVEAYVAGPAFFGDSPPEGNPTAPVNTAHFIYGKILGLPSHLTVTTRPDVLTCTPGSVVFNDDCTTAKAPFDLNTYGGTFTKIEFQALDDPTRSLAAFSTWDESVNPPVWSPSSSLDADGVVYHDLIDAHQQPFDYTIAMQLSGLQGASMTGSTEQVDSELQTFSPHSTMTFNLSVDKSLAQPFNVDVQTDHTALTIDPQNLFGPPIDTTSPVSLLEGFLDRPQPDMHLTLDTSNEGTVQPEWSTTRVHFGANGCPGDGSPCSIVGTAISRVHIEGFQQDSGGMLSPVGGKQMIIDVANIPNELNVCLGTDTPLGGGGPSGSTTGSTDQSGCLADRPRPSANFGPPLPYYPPDQPTPVGSDPNGWGEMDANHQVVLNVDDAGTSGNTDASALTINAYICLKTLTLGAVYSGKEPNITCDQSLAPAVTSDQAYRLNGPGSSLTITNLKIHNILLDLYAEACSGALLCGHIGLDTRNQHFSGNFHYFDQSITVLDSKLLIIATLNFPTGFNTDYRYTDFRNQAIPPAGKYDREWGHISCNSDSPPSIRPTMNIRVDIAAGPTITAPDIFARFLCHVYDQNKPNYWYPAG